MSFQETLLSVAFGAVLGAVLTASLGFGTAVLIDYIRRRQDKQERVARGKKLLLAIVEEAEEGISRCQRYSQLKEEGKFSFSRVYTALWESGLVELSENIEDIGTLMLLHEIYYRFDLVNFLMEGGEYARGGQMASDHLPKMQANLTAVKEKLSGMN